MGRFLAAETELKMPLTRKTRILGFRRGWTQELGRHLSVLLSSLQASLPGMFSLPPTEAGVHFLHSFQQEFPVVLHRSQTPNSMDPGGEFANSKGHLSGRCAIDGSNTGSRTGTASMGAFSSLKVPLCTCVCWVRERGTVDLRWVAQSLWGSGHSGLSREAADPASPPSCPLGPATGQASSSGCSPALRNEEG